MSTRFSIDLAHPGHVADTWQDWFIGPQGRRRWVIAAAGCGIVLVVVIALILPTRIRLSQDVGAIPRLRADLAARQGDLNVLRANLQALSLEARRQVRWAEMLNAFRQQIPATLKLQKVEVGAVPAASTTAQSGQAQPVGAPPAAASELRIEAVTPLRPGPPPLIEIAQFMGGLMKDPTVGRRYQLKSWEIKQAGAGGSQPAGEREQLLVLIVLSEKLR
ncbi:MAG TPA: hypothetical protein VNP91_14380 [Methylomirabilota bacterium]|nr:hypothetical protein [Methylomirabilota bacterium]